MSWLWLRTKEITALGSAGIALAFLIILFLWLLLPKQERTYLRVPITFLALHILVVIIKGAIPQQERVQAILEVLGLLFLLISLARSAFLLVLHSVLIRRFAHPIPRIFRDLLQALIYAGVVLITLRAAGVEPGSLLTTSALLTAVIGLSLQDTLGNMFAGLAIQAQRPFDTGDWIQFDDQPEHVGKVLEMNWRAIKLLTLERVEITVPNAMLAKAAIRNYTKPSSLVRRSERFHLPFDIPPHRIQVLIADVVSGLPGVAKDPNPSVVTEDFSERGTKFWVRYYIDDYSKREIISGLVRDRIWYVLHREGLPISVPMRVVKLQNDKKDHTQSVKYFQQALEKVDFLSNLSDEDRYELASVSVSRLYAKDETIIEQGQSGDLFFLILQGQVEVLATSNSKQVEVAQLGPFQYFGEMSLLTGEPRRATVRTVEETTVLTIDKYALQPILNSNQEAIETISHVLAEREARLNEQLLSQPLEKITEVENRSNELLVKIRELFSL